MIKKTVSIYKDYKWQVSLLLVVIFLNQSLGLVSPYFFGLLTDSIIKKESIWLSISLASVGLVTAGISFFLRYARVRINLGKIWFPIQEYVRMKTVDNYLMFSIGQHKNIRSGISREIISSGENSMLRLADMIVISFVPTGIQIIITAVAVLLMKFELGLVIVAGLAIYSYSAFKLKNKYSEKIKDRYEKNLTSAKHKGEILAGAALIKAHTKEEQQREEHRGKYQISANASKLTRFYMIKWDGLLWIFVEFVDFIALAFGILLIYRGTLSVGELITISSWWNMLTSMINNIQNQLQDFLTEWTSAKKFLELIEIPPAIKETEHAVSLNECHGYITFRDVSFSYPDKEGKPGKKVLDRVSLFIHAGEKVAIVGRSGSGKSTLITLLQRGYDPDSGIIEVDGYNLRMLKLKDYYRYIAVVDQNSLMLDATIRENLLLGASIPLTDQELIQLCSLVELDLSSFQEGLDQTVGENGKLISGGERQRLAIARALAANPRILILDEATASLDGIMESEIQHAIDIASRNRTTIIIAHRLATVQNADRIFLIDDHRIVAVGTHRELLRKSPLYHELVEKQKIYT